MDETDKYYGVRGDKMINKYNRVCYIISSAERPFKAKCGSWWSVRKLFLRPNTGNQTPSPELGSCSQAMGGVLIMRCKH